MGPVRPEAAGGLRATGRGPGRQSGDRRRGAGPGRPADRRRRLCQAIYGWRGAVDALATWPAQQRLYLQQSWRFGPAIADHANRWLRQIGAPIRLQGDPGRASRVLTGALGDRADAVLCRTNAEAMARAMAVLADNRRPALVGGAGQIKDLAKAALDLKAGRPTSHPELLAFSTWEQLRTYVNEERTGSDLRVFVRLIDDYGPEAVLRAVNSLVEEKYADVIVSTAHRAKGREWDTVLIADDFSEPRPLQNGAPGKIRKEEAMLAYVAVTRAKRRSTRRDSTGSPTTGDAPSGRHIYLRITQTGTVESSKAEISPASRPCCESQQGRGGLGSWPWQHHEGEHRAAGRGPTPPRPCARKSRCSQATPYALRMTSWWTDWASVGPR